MSSKDRLKSLALDVVEKSFLGDAKRKAREDKQSFITVLGSGSWDPHWRRISLLPGPGAKWGISKVKGNRELGNQYWCDDKMICPNCLEQITVSGSDIKLFEHMTDMDLSKYPPKAKKQIIAHCKKKGHSLPYTFLQERKSIACKTATLDAQRLLFKAWTATKETCEESGCGDGGGPLPYMLFDDFVRTRNQSHLREQLLLIIGIACGLASGLGAGCGDMRRHKLNAILEKTCRERLKAKIIDSARENNKGRLPRLGTSPQVTFETSVRKLLFRILKAFATFDFVAYLQSFEHQMKQGGKSTCDPPHVLYNTFNAFFRAGLFFDHFSPIANVKLADGVDYVTTFLVASLDSIDCDVTPLLIADRQKHQSRDHWPRSNYEEEPPNCTE